MESKSVFEHARLIGDWMVKNQVINPFDANHGRGIGIYNARTGYLNLSVNWTTGIMAACLCAMYKRTGEQKYLDAAIRAGKYVMSLQLLDERKKEYFGLFRELTPQSIECAPRDAVSAAWGLVWLFNTTGEREFLERAKIFAEWHMNYVMLEGWPRFALYMRDDMPDFYAQGAFQSGTGLFYHDLFVASGDARLIERGFKPIAVNYRDRFFNDDGSIILGREAFTGQKGETGTGVKMHSFNDDFGGAMLMVAADFFKDESFRDKAMAYARWLMLNQDADGGFGGGKAPSGVPTALMYFHDLGTEYGDRELLSARDKTLNKLLSLQHIATGDAKLDGGIEGACECINKMVDIPGAPQKHVNLRCTNYALIALLKLEGRLEGIWLGRHNGKWTDPLHHIQTHDTLTKLGYINWNEAR
jgi:hypothetical protein